MKDYRRITEKKELIECEIVKDKRYSVGFRQIPHKISKNIIKGIHTIYNDMDRQGDYITGDVVDKIADLEDKIESGEIDYVADKENEIDCLNTKIDELRAKLKRAIKFVECCPADDCAGDWSVGIFACPLWDFDDIDENGNQIEGGCVLKKWAKELNERDKQL